MLLALLIVVVIFAPDPILPDSIFSILVIALIPLSITVAVLRYQLLDIQLVLSRITRTSSSPRESSARTS